MHPIKFVFPRRALQRELLCHARKSSASVAITKELVEQLACEFNFKLRWPIHDGDVKDAIKELVQQRVLACEGEWDFGSVCSLGAQPILGEMPEERFAALPELPELPHWMILIGNLLIGLDALFFFVFYCTYLPQSWIGPVTGTGALIGALLSYAGLRLSDQRALTALHWTMRKWLAVLIVGALLATLTCIGYVNPCIVKAPPGAQILVDGKMVATVPTIVSDNPLDWLANKKERLHLRWDSHEIHIRKKWWVTGEWHDDSVGTVELQWTRPRHLFEKWTMEAQLVPLLRITPDSVLPADRTGSAPLANKSSFDEEWRAAVAGWDSGLQASLTATAAGMDETPLKPFVLRVEVRTKTDKSGMLTFAFFNLKGEMLRPFLPIAIRDVSDQSEIESARQRVFSELEDELQIKKLEFKGTLQDAIAAATVIQHVAEMLPHDPSIAASVVSTTAALPKLAAQIRQSGTFSSEKLATQASLWNSAAVANEAVRLGHPDQAAQVATEISKVGEAAAAAGRIETAKVAESSLAQIIAAPAEGPPDAKIAEDLSASHKRVASAIALANTQSSAIKPRVYLHIGGESQRSSAAGIEAALQSAGFVVPGIQNVLGRAYIPDTAEVRYFVYPEAKTKADEILAILKRAGCKDGRSSYLKPSARDVATSSDISTHFEVWFGKNSFGPQGKQ
jgi:hypothetical protein